ncbi:hypothetical protein IIA16_03090 [bacterium]|nr:hypothetical protein [bacterium]
MRIPTGDEGSAPPLGSGSTDFMVGLTAAHESRRWYVFGDVRIMRPGRGAGGLRGGMATFADVAVGLRPRQTGYREGDMVYLLELNWESNRRARQGGGPVPGSAAERLFLSPGFFYTFTNYALKGGIQFPISEDLDGGGPAADWRASLAFEVHL